VNGTWREGSLAVETEGYVEKALETFLSIGARFEEPGGGLVYRGL
jgi:hypothetical protein